MGVKKKKSFFSIIIDVILFTLFFLSISYFAISFYAYSYPYEYNYYYNKYIKKIDIEKISIDRHNEYYRDYDFLYVQNSKYIFAHNKQDLINALYTLVNSGQNKVEFYCSKEYKDCIKDAKLLINDEKDGAINYIRVFGHPFNDYKSISYSGDKGTLKVVYRIYKKYSKDKISQVNAEVDRIYNELYNSNDDIITNIYRIHDYLANTIDYDKTKSDFIEKKTDIDSIYDSTTAYGALIEHKAICSGYTDAMYLFLDRMGLKSMRVTSKTHIWNAVYLDDNWYHLDLTWDDSKYTSGRPYLSHKYFFVDTPTLLSLDSKSHTFDTEIYKELS